MGLLGNSKFRDSSGYKGLNENGAIQPHDEISVRLVAAGLKPSACVESMTSISPLDVKRQFESAKLNVSIKHKNFITPEGDEEKHIVIYVAKTEENLARLESANNHVEMGLALGFPKEAVERFAELNKVGRVPATEFMQGMADALLKGYLIPGYVAYLTHVPASYDFSKGTLNEGSMRIGIESQAYFVKRDAEFTETVKAKFLRNMMAFVNSEVITATAEERTSLRRAVAKLMHQ